MRSFLSVGLGLFLLFATGCLNQSKPLAPNNETPKETPFPVQKSMATRVATPPPADQLSTQAIAINTFAVSLYKYLAAQPEAGNLFFSPYSITEALAMTEAGSKGETQRQIRQALAVTLQGDEFHAAMNGLDQSLSNFAGTTDGLTLKIVNSTWMQTGWDFKVSYLDQLSRYYGAGVNLLDFIASPEPSRVIINTWVEEQTNNKILELIPQGAITSDTRLVLTNAIYFLGNWLNQFDSSLTQNSTFTKLDNSTITPPIMQLWKDHAKKMKYHQTGTARAIDLPYKGDRLCMTVILPESGFFSAFESAITIDSITKMVQGLDSVTLPPVQLPKFTFTSKSISLLDALKALGMNDAFDFAKADFSGIDGTRRLFISEVFHKAFIAVDEKGTEAAAATAVIIAGYGSPPPNFIADRPFIFLIRDRVTGVILFMGRILDPLAKE
jgi:serpin B